MIYQIFNYYYFILFGPFAFYIERVIKFVFFFFFFFVWEGGESVVFFVCQSRRYLKMGIYLLSSYKKMTTELFWEASNRLYNSFELMTKGRISST